MADVIDLPTGLITPVVQPPRRGGRYSSDKIIPGWRLNRARNLRMFAAKERDKARHPPTFEDKDATVSVLKVLLNRAIDGEVKHLAVLFTEESGCHGIRVTGRFRHDPHDAASTFLATLAGSV